ncbi:hypothetical protein C8J42_101938 [Sphingomonas sp. PP-CE-1A-559]|uniref:hypothetical protein n=1 Tax=Sphingomonas sp. PP-CE-1A-559 TaxID=2135657 RepID=UPI00105672E7|nr:hypothetical protein [Sphingomonas sp. PP-CE-1A-559]TCP94472.1 hypothetical protein C8J42_101938 [Sphingomonas sp. PP-CE-1A-559]
MTGVDIIGALLVDDEAVLEMHTAERIKAGALADGVVLPALLVRLVSSVERQPLKRGGSVRTVDRIAVTVRSKTYAEQTKAIGLVRKACAGRTGDVGEAKSVSVLTAGAGPDARGPGNSFEQTQDFRVSFDAPA